MNKRLLRLALAAALVLSSAFTSAAPVAAKAGDCATYLNAWYERTGMTNTSPSVYRTSVKATFNPDGATGTNTNFRQCTDVGAGAVAAYVQLYPRDVSQSGCDLNGQCAIRFGIINCSVMEMLNSQFWDTIQDPVFGQSPCSNVPGQVWYYFIYYGGCASSDDVNYHMFKDGVTLGPHSYEIVLDWNYIYHFKHDGNEVFTLNRAMATIVGISTGTSSPSAFQYAAYGVYGQGYFSPNWNSANPCHVQAYRDYCDVTNTTTFLVGTQNP